VGEVTEGNVPVRHRMVSSSTVVAGEAHVASPISDESLGELKLVFVKSSSGLGEMMVGHLLDEAAPVEELRGVEDHVLIDFSLLSFLMSPHELHGFYISSAQRHGYIPRDL